MVYTRRMPTDWIDRQVDEVLLTTATAAGLLYARRRVRRLLPKVMVGGAVVAGLGAAATAAIAAAGVLGVAGAGTAWYRHRSKAVASSNGWKATPAAAGGNSQGAFAPERATD